MMKRITGILATGMIALLFLWGCGNDNEGQEEAIRTMEESFALDSGEEQEASPDQQRTTTRSGDSQQRTTSRDTSTNTSSSRDTSQTANTSGSGDNGTAREVDPGVQQIARETVQLMQGRQYDTAVENLDRLMAQPGLTSAQRSAARRTMAEIQKQIIRDPNISEAEKERAKQVLQRQQ